MQITVAEELGMAGGRGGYYDNSGALRDMVQNHLMQLLCLVAMEPPVDLSADAVRNERVKVLEALPTWTYEDVDRNVVRGQYTAGSIQGKEVPGYLQEKGVKPDSTTETYVAIRLTLNTWRWAGVPFFLRTGKRLPKRASEIAIQFRKPPTTLFEVDTEEAGGGTNLLVLRIQPNEGASLAFQAKIPGSRRRLQEVRMDFRYGTAFAVPAARGLRAAPARRHARRPDPLHPDRRRSRAPGGSAPRSSTPGTARRAPAPGLPRRDLGPGGRRRPDERRDAAGGGSEPVSGQPPRGVQDLELKISNSRFENQFKISNPKSGISNPIIDSRFESRFEKFEIRDSRLSRSENPI